MITPEDIADGLLTVILAPFILIILLAYFIYWIVTGLTALFYAFCEGSKELWRYGHDTW